MDHFHTLMDKDKIETYGINVVWILLSIGVINNLFENSATRYLGLGILAFLNIIKIILSRKFIYKDSENKSVYTSKNIWYVLRSVDISMIIIAILLIDNSGSIAFSLLVLSCLVLFAEEESDSLTIIIISDILCFSALIFDMYQDELLGKDIELLLFKGCLIVIIQWFLKVFSGAIHKSYKENEESLFNFKNTYNEIEHTHKMLEDKTHELEKNKEILEHNAKELEIKNSKLSKNVAELYTMQEVSKFITSTLNIDELLNLINDILLGIMGVNYSTILMNNSQTGKLEVVVSNIKETDENDRMLKLFSPVIDQVVTTREPVLKSNAEDSEMKNFNIGSLLCIPLLVKKQLVGISIASHENEKALNKESLNFLSTVLNQVSIAIENAQLYREMQQMAEIDGLTRIYNRLYFQKNYAEIRKQQDVETLAVAIFDVDLFKKFNDTYGHQFGDDVLVQVANAGRKYLEQGEFVSRYGGEEFVIVFKNKKEQYVIEKLERIRRTIEQTKVSNGTFTASVTASFGVAFYPKTYNSIDEHLLTCADDALYESKKSGRNKLTVAKDDI